MDFGLVLILSFDTFLACLAYGVKKITIPFFSILVLALVGTGFLSISLFFQHLLREALPTGSIRWIGFAVLLFIGLLNTGESLMKRLIRRHLPMEHSMKVSCLRFTINVYLDKTYADKDASQSLSCTEAFLLAVPLSMDSLATGLSIAPATKLSAGLIIGFSLLCGILFACAGTAFGKQLKAGHADLSWISGVLLILLAIGKLL